MVSRIDIGPDGGPYVAINENSNDLELQDINGNVVAVWDETAGQWDLNNKSLTNINAIDASSASVEQLDGGIANGNTVSEITQFDSTEISVSANSQNFVFARDVVSNISSGEARERVISIQITPSEPPSGSGNYRWDSDTSGEETSFETDRFIQPDGLLGIRIFNNTGNDESVKVTVVYT